MAALEHISLPHLNQQFYRSTLSNGLKVILIPKPQFKETTAMLSVDFGGLDSSFTVNSKAIAQPYGLAHFLEHQVFENKGKQDFSQLFTALGTDSNAFTSFTSTNFFFSGLDNIEDSLELLLNLVSEARFTELSTEKERPIIKQELDMYQDDPDHYLYSTVLSSLFPDTALAADIAGHQESLEQISFSDLETAFHHFYRPDLMTLVMVGDFSVEEVYSWLTKLSTKLKKTRRNKPVRSAIAYQPVVKKQSVQMDVAMPKLGLGFRSLPNDANLLFYKTGLRLYLNMLLGWTSKTYQAWYDSGKIDDSFEMTLEVDTRFQFVMILLDTVEPIAMSAKIKQALKKGRTSKDISEEHLFLLKKEMYGEFLSSLDRVDELASLYLEHSTDELTYLDFPDVLDQLTLEAVLTIGEQFFQTAESVDVTIFPR